MKDYEVKIHLVNQDDKNTKPYVYCKRVPAEYGQWSMMDFLNSPNRCEKCLELYYKSRKIETSISGKIEKIVSKHHPVILSMTILRAMAIAQTTKELEKLFTQTLSKERKDIVLKICGFLESDYGWDYRHAVEDWYEKRYGSLYKEEKEFKQK